MAEWTLIVTFGGVLVAAVTFVCNQVHAMCARRRDFLVAVLEAVNLSFSGLLGDVESHDQNKAIARAAAMAELGLNGKTRQTALDCIYRLGPHDAPVGGEAHTVTRKEALDQAKDVYNEFVPELWRHAHPFRSGLWRRQRPEQPLPDEVYYSTGPMRRE